MWPCQLLPSLCWSNFFERRPNLSDVQISDWENPRNLWMKNYFLNVLILSFIFKVSLWTKKKCCPFCRWPIKRTQNINDWPFFVFAHFMDSVFWINFYFLLTPFLKAQPLLILKECYSICQLRYMPTSQILNFLSYFTFQTMFFFESKQTESRKKKFNLKKLQCAKSFDNSDWETLD